MIASCRVTRRKVAMRRIRSRCVGPRVCIIAVLSAQLLSAGPVPSSESREQPFLEKAPQQWEEYVRLATNLEGSVQFEQIDRRASDKVIRHSESRFVLDGRRAVYVFKPADEKWHAEGANAEYGFEIAAEPGGDWYITNIDWDANAEVPREPVGRGGPVGTADAYGLATKLACSGLVIFSTWFPDVAASPAFQVRDLTAIAEGDEECVKVEFEYHPAETDPRNVVRSGMVVLDPERYWLIREAEVRGEWGGGRETGTITVRNEFADDKAPFPVITRQVMHVSAASVEPDSQVEHDWIREFDLSERADDDESRFTLAAFGLPEPEEEPGERTRVALRLSLAVTVLVLLTLGALLWRRRESRTA